MSKKAIAIAVAAAVLVGVGVFLPEILSSTVGKRLLIGTIEAKTGGKADAASLHFSWFGPQEASGITMQSPGYEGSIEKVRAEIPLWGFAELMKPENLFGIKGNLSVQGGSFRFQEEGTEAKVEDLNISFRLHEDAADFSATGQSLIRQERGSFSIQGHFGKGDNFSLQGDVNSLPTASLARVLAMSLQIDKKALLDIIGDSFSFKGFASMQGQKGSCDFSFHAPNCDAQVRGNLNENLFTLSEPLLGTIRLTPSLAQKILDGVNPLFVTGISSSSPIQVRIETRQFRLFLKRPFHWKSLQIGGGMIDVGKIRCSNGSTLGALIGMLKNSPLTQAKEMEVWFTPLYFKLENGVLETGRMDALAAKSIRFCSWGNIDLVKEKLDMTLGLTAETLRSVFGLKTVSEDYVLKIPITGSIRSPKLAVGAGAAKIAALLAAQGAPKGGGGLLNLFLKPDTDIPKPNRPFPWE